MSTPLAATVRQPNLQIKRVETNAGGGDLHGAVEYKFVHVFVRLGGAVAVNVLHFYRRIIHQDADCESETTEGHDVDGLTDETQRNQRSQNGERNGSCNNERASPAAEKNENSNVCFLRSIRVASPMLTVISSCDFLSRTRSRSPSRDKITPETLAFSPGESWRALAAVTANVELVIRTVATVQRRALSFDIRAIFT